VIEQDGDLLVMFGDFSGERGVFGHDLANSHEGAHDFDVYFDSPFAAEDGGEHGDSLLGEGEGGILGVAAAAGF